MSEVLAMRKVLSYSLFSVPRKVGHPVDWYARFLPAVIRAHLALFPPEDDFELRLHHDASLYRLREAPLLLRLHRTGLVRLVHRADRATTLCAPMLWRLDPIWDPEVSRVFCRDVDALPTPRDRYAVEAFLDSGKAFHDLRDSPSHGGGLCGGLCGFDARKIREAQPTRADLDRVLSRVLSLRRPENEGMRLAVGGVLVGSLDPDEPGWDQTVLNLWARTVALGSVDGMRGGASEGEEPWAEDALRVGPRPGEARARLDPPNRRLLDVSPLALEKGDWLRGPLDTPSPLPIHLGQAGFDVETVTAFYDEVATAHGADRRVVALFESVSSDAVSPHPLPTPAPREPLAEGGIRRIVIASDRNPDYYPFLPLTALLWRRLGFKPTAILVGPPSAWRRDPAAALALDEAVRVAEAEVHFVREDGGVGHPRTSTVAQVVRLYACALPGIALGDELAATDVDLWPLSPKAALPPPPGFFRVTYGNAHAAEPRGAEKWPICHLVASSAVWREVVFGPKWPPPAWAVTVDGALVSALYALDACGRADAETAWNHDEATFAACLRAWPFFAERVVFEERVGGFGAIPVDRIDRSKWPKTITDRESALAAVASEGPSGVVARGRARGRVDAHLPRPLGAHWEASGLRHLFAALAPLHADWADEYVRCVGQIESRRECWGPG